MPYITPKKEIYFIVIIWLDFISETSTRKEGKKVLKLSFC